MSDDNRGNNAHGVLEREQTPAVLEPGPRSNNGQPSSDNRLSGMPRRKKVMLACAAGLLVALAAYFIRNVFLYEDTDDAQVDGHVMPLSARIRGQVLKVNFVEGQLVHADEVLVIIDPEDFQVAMDQAKAALDDAKASAASSHWNVPITSVTVGSNLDSAETAVTNAEAALKAAEHNYESAKAALVQAEANAVKSDSDLERYKQLVAKEDISRQLYDQAVAAATGNRAAVTSAQATVQAAEQAVRQSEGKLVQAKADLRTAQTAPQQVSLTVARANAADAQVQQRQAELAQAQLNFSYTIIRSPVTGIIGKKTVEVGQNVSIGQEMLEVVPLDDIWVTANFKETQLAHMRPGQPVEVHVDAYGHTWSGHVTNMGGGTGSVFSLLPPENATGNYVKVVQRLPVRIRFAKGQDPNHLLRPGMSVEPTVMVK